MPIRILHLLKGADVSNTAASRIVLNLARHIDRQRHELSVWFLARGGPLAREMEAAGCRTRVFNLFRGSRQPMEALRFWRAVRSEAPAIIHQHFGGRSVRKLARWGCDGPVIVHLHSRGREACGSAPLEIALSGVDAAIAVSRAVAEIVVGIPIKVIYPGVEVGEARCPRGQRPLVIGSAGRLVEIKGYTYLIQAMRPLMTEFPECRLEIAGDGPERAKLEAEVAAFGLCDRVSFLGWKPNIRSVMRNWDLYVQPSLEEGFGLAVLEAMATGLPVVASASGGLVELIEHASTGWLVPPGDSATLGQCLQKAIRDFECLDAMGAAGRARVLRYFSAELMAAQISGIYDKILQTPRTGSALQE